MKRLFAFTLVIFLFTAVSFMGYAEEKMISGKVTALDAKAGTVKIKTEDGKEQSLKGSEEQLSEIKVGDDVEAVVNDGKIVSIYSLAGDELPEEESPE